MNQGVESNRITQYNNHSERYYFEFFIGSSAARLFSTKSQCDKYYITIKTFAIPQLKIKEFCYLENTPPNRETK